MTPAERVEAVIVLLGLGATMVLDWRDQQRRKAAEAIARGTVETARDRVLDHVALVVTALVVSGIAFYSGRYGEWGIALVLGLVWLAFTGWRWLKRGPIDRTP